MKPLALLCLAALCLSASAARLGSWGESDSMEIMMSKLSGAGRFRASDVDRKGKGESVDEWLDRTAFVAIKYRVPPSMHDKFEDEWYKLYKTVDKEEKNIMTYNLLKTMEDNMNFVTYGEWDTQADYIEHMHSGHMMDFMDFLEDADITYELFPLKNVTSIEKETRRMRNPGAQTEDDGDDVEKRKKREKMIHIVFHYHTEPSTVGDFIDSWHDMAKDVWDEKGNVVFSLRKVGTNNHHWFGCGTWDSYEDFMDHITSKHVKEFRDFIRKNDITLMWEPVKMVEGDRV